MTYLDTHVVIWLYAGRLAQLSAKARGQIDQDDLLISPTVLLELQYLKEIGRLKTSPSKILSALEKDVGLRTCDLPFSEVVEAALGQRWVRDPFDRLIMGHAKANDAPLVTKDEKSPGQLQAGDLVIWFRRNTPGTLPRGTWFRAANVRLIHAPCSTNSRSFLVYDFDRIQARRHTRRIKAGKDCRQIDQTQG